MKLYSSAAWTDLGGGGEPGQLPTYTTAERNAIASPAYGLMVYNTDTARVEYYLPDAWAAIQAPFAGGHSCTAAIDCASEICVDGYCCNTLCTGNCNRCNVVGSLGTCTEVASDCTGNCDVCSSGNCAAVEAMCTGNCDVCSGSGTAYTCAASNALCSNNTSSCGCSGSGTSFNCSTCTDDPYGVCGHPTCSSYTCDQAYDNGTACATCKTCSSGSCSAYVPAGTTGLNCTATHYRCNGGGACTAPCGGYTYFCTNDSNCTGGASCAGLGQCASVSCVIGGCSMTTPPYHQTICLGWQY